MNAEERSALRQRLAAKRYRSIEEIERAEENWWDTQQDRAIADQWRSDGEVRRAEADWLRPRGEGTNQ